MHNAEAAPEFERAAASDGHIQEGVMGGKRIENAREALFFQNQAAFAIFEPVQAGQE